MFYVFLLSAFFWKFFLCQDHWHGNVSPHLAQPCYVALRWTLDSGLMLFLMVFFVYRIMLFCVCLSSCISVCVLYVCILFLCFIFFHSDANFIVFFCYSMCFLSFSFNVFAIFILSFSSGSMCLIHSVFLSFFLFHWMAYFISGTGRWGSRLEQIANW